MVTVTRRFEFDYAHRVLGHEGRCKDLHGHRAVAEVTVQAPELDPLGRVIDFGVLKQLVGKWIDDNWDHACLLNCKDPIFNLPDPDLLQVTGRMPYIMRGGANPTAETIARDLHFACVNVLPAHIKVVTVRVWETPNCHADYTPSPE